MTGSQLAAARISTRLFFVLAGFANAAWAPMVPYAKARTGLGTATFGLVLIGLGVGAVAVMPLISWGLGRYGSRRVLFAGALLLTITLPLLGWLASPVLLAAALIVFGFSIGTFDAAMNTQAVEVERLSARPMMSGFHGMFSVGGLIGSLGLTILLGAGLAVSIGAVLTAAVVLLVALWRVPSLLPGVESPPAERRLDEPRTRRAFHPLVVLVGVLCFVGFLGEGAALDWSALFLHGKGLPAAYGGLGYAAFSVTMACGRLSGDRLTRRFGTVPLLRVSALIATAGWCAVVFLPGPAAVLGFALVGVGASNIVPLLFSAAARVPGVPASISIPVISAVGYAGMLCGPGIIGFVAGATSLGTALVIVGVLTLSVFGAARRAVQA
ncbi:MFS transporter [Acidisoma cellulosilyticum]|uniref:MFS transporter n=1 Tax=Acidisoma cellulosilyticum TaxID=2802395 RepID=UPI001D0ABCE1|nr:MFS transporter [Acidisoma cellulosilyticum]